MLKIEKKGRKRQIYDVIFLNFGHLKQNENYEVTFHVYLYANT